MVYYLTNHDSNDRATIDMFDTRQVAWWCRALDVTPEELWQAVREVGNKPQDIRGYLRAYSPGAQEAP